MKKNYRIISCCICYLLLLTSHVEAFINKRLSSSSIKPRIPCNNERHISEIQEYRKSVRDMNVETVKFSSLSILKSVSLDTAVLPTDGLRISQLPPRISLLIIVSTMLSLFLASPAEGIKDTKGLFGGKLWPVTDVLIPGINLLIRILLAKVGLLIESAVKKVASIGLPEEKDFVGRDDWSICTLSERESISNKYVKYRFELDNPSSYIPLDIGQEVPINISTISCLHCFNLSSNSPIHHSFHFE